MDFGNYLHLIKFIIFCCLNKTFNEKDLIKPTASILSSNKSSDRIKGSDKKTKSSFKESYETLNEKPSKLINPGMANKKLDTELNMKKSTHASDISSAYNRPGNRVSFQPSTEFLKHYKSSNISRQGATTGIKRAASASLCKKDLIIRSESIIHSKLSGH